MARYLLVSAGKVSNVILWDGEREYDPAGVEIRVPAAGDIIGVTPTSFSTVPPVGPPRPWVPFSAIPPLYCIAFTADLAQVPNIARYPVALVPQDVRTSALAFLDAIRAANPAIKLLAYHEATTFVDAPTIGAGFARMWQLPASSRLSTTAFGRPILDPRTDDWKTAFAESCAAVLASYPFDGLFIDNCTVFVVSDPDPVVRTAMTAARQTALTALRAASPNTLIVGNCADRWTGINGRMNEGRPTAYATEFAPLVGQSTPTMNLAQMNVATEASLASIRSAMQKAHQHQAYFGLSNFYTSGPNVGVPDYQTVIWHAAFDEVVARYA